MSLHTYLCYSSSTNSIFCHYSFAFPISFFLFLSRSLAFLKLYLFLNSTRFCLICCVFFISHSLSLSFSLSLVLSFSLTHTHSHTHTRTQLRGRSSSLAPSQRPTQSRSAAFVRSLSISTSTPHFLFRR